jgi:hypothetical protein
MACPRLLALTHQLREESDRRLATKGGESSVADLVIKGPEVPRTKVNVRQRNLDGHATIAVMCN